jgi:hypothetical protein
MGCRKKNEGYHEIFYSIITTHKNNPCTLRCRQLHNQKELPNKMSGGCTKRARGMEPGYRL